MVREGFKADHLRKGGNSGWGELQLEVLLKNVAEGAYEIRVCVSVKALYEHVGAGWCGVVHGVTGALAVLGECIVGVGVLDL